jgi:hypothetical protein
MVQAMFPQDWHSTDSLSDSSLMFSQSFVSMALEWVIVLEASPNVSI